MKVYDCFQFFNELDLLRLRMEILSPVVDYFVISEATTTFSGLKKPLYYLENKALFKDFADRVIHVTVEDTPPGDTHVRDTFQKNAVGRGLAGAEPEDMVIFSDLDEIPDPVKVAELLQTPDREKIYHFAQRLFYCYLNLEEVTGKLLSYAGEFEGVKRKRWIGSKLCSFSLLQKTGLKLGELRFPERKAIGIRIEGGWHFSYMGGRQERDITARIAEKVRSAAHTEYDNERILRETKKRLLAGLDPFGRDARFERVALDEGFPEYLREHQEEYAYLILPPVSPVKTALSRAGIRAEDSLRKGEVAVKRLIKKCLGTYKEE